MICTPPTAGTCAPATWSTNRDIAAARLSWERARQIADALPADDPDRPRCGSRRAPCCVATAWRVDVSVADDRLRRTARAVHRRRRQGVTGHRHGRAGDRHAYHGRHREASQLASEAMALIESIGDPTLTVGLSFAAIYAKNEAGEMADVLRWSSASSTWPTATRPRATSSWDRPWRSPLWRGRLPDMPWVVTDGETTCGGASPWPAAPTRCPSHGYHLRLCRGNTDGVLRPDDTALSDIEEAFGSPSDPATTRVRRRPADARHCAGAPTNGWGT